MMPERSNAELAYAFSLGSQVTGRPSGALVLWVLGTQFDLRLNDATIAAEGGGRVNRNAATRVQGGAGPCVALPSSREPVRWTGLTPDVPSNGRVGSLLPRCAHRLRSGTVQVLADPAVACETRRNRGVGVCASDEAL